ncbi:MAG TPA: hypothetical protein ENN68_06810 [Methanomicrobia archaeon]|nr:hypothetical protein [Methanomicrobia archaeon]
MIGVLCTGCRLGITVGILNLAKNNNIPLIISGGTPFEGQGYKTNIMKVNPNGGMSSFVSGYLYQIVRNPKWIMNSDSLITQGKEFYYYFYPGRKKLAEKMGITQISPFHAHLHWRENEILRTIKTELNWREYPGIKSTWRGDCEIAILKDYLYKKTLGFNDKDDGLSSLIRDHQLTRAEALERLNNEGDVPEQVLQDIFEKHGLDYSDLKIALEKIV